MSSKTKIVVVKLKDILFYATVVTLCIIVLLLLYILFQPKEETAPTGSTITVQYMLPAEKILYIENS